MEAIKLGLGCSPFSPAILCNRPHRLTAASNSCKTLFRVCDSLLARAATTNFAYSHLSVGHLSLQNEQFAKYFSIEILVGKRVKGTLKLVKSLRAYMPRSNNAILDAAFGTFQANNGVDSQSQRSFCDSEVCLKPLNVSNLFSSFSLVLGERKATQNSRNGADCLYPVSQQRGICVIPCHPKCQVRDEQSDRDNNNNEAYLFLSHRFPCQKEILS